LAEGTNNVTSLEPPQEEAPLIQIHDVDDLDSVEAHEVLDEDDSVTKMQTGEAVVERTGQRDQENEVIDVERSEQQRTTTSSKEPLQPKNKGERIEEMMRRYLDMRTKQVQDESADLAKEKEDLAKENEVAQGNDFSIKRCISVLSTMEVTKEEKAKAFAMFIKSKENREAFLTGCELDQESTLIWLKNEMA
jgi:predicted neuraminidase